MLHITFHENGVSYDNFKFSRLWVWVLDEIRVYGVRSGYIFYAENGVSRFRPNVDTFYQITRWYIPEE
jgi:hypothetical protein